MRRSRVGILLAAGAVGGGYAAVIAWTWWLNLREAEPATRVPLEIFAAAMVVVVIGIVWSAWLSHRAAAEPSRDNMRRRWCKRVTGMLIGPLAAILMLSGLYATFRFDDSRALPVGLLLLMTSAGGFAACLTCAWQERRNQARRST